MSSVSCLWCSRRAVLEHGHWVVVVVVVSVSGLWVTSLLFASGSVLLVFSSQEVLDVGRSR